MNDPEADKLNREGEEPEAESGAGYGSHAPDEDTTPQETVKPEDKSA